MITFDDLVQDDGSVIAEKTKGEISTRYDKEEMDFLALNLANDVATRNTTVAQARAGYYAKAAMDFMQGQNWQALKFTVAKAATGNRDLPAKM